MGTEKAILIAESTLEDESAKADLRAFIRKAVFDELDCPLADIRIVPRMWLLKTSSGKIARRPNLEKYQQTFLSQDESPVAPQARPAPVHWMLMTAWSLVIAVTIYVIPLMFSGINKSWNIYMRF